MKYFNGLLAVLAGILVVFSPVGGMDKLDLGTSQLHFSEEPGQPAEDPAGLTKSTIFPREEKKQSSPLPTPIKALTASPTAAEIKPNQTILEAVKNQNKIYFDKNPDDLTKSIPYFINHAQDNDKAKNNALNILDIIHTRKECSVFCQSAMKGFQLKIKEGYPVDPYNVLTEIDQIKFPRKQLIFGDASHATLISHQSKELNTETEKRELNRQLVQQRSELNKLKFKNKKPSLDWLKKQEGILEKYIPLLEATGYDPEKISRPKKELENVQKAIKKDTLKSSISRMTEELKNEASVSKLVEYKNALKELQKIDPQENRTELIKALDEKIESLQKEESIREYVAKILPEIREEIEEKLPGLAAQKFKKQQEQEKLEKTQSGLSLPQQTVVTKITPLETRILKRIELEEQSRLKPETQKRFSQSFDLEKNITLHMIYDINSYTNLPDQQSLDFIQTLISIFKDESDLQEEIKKLRGILLYIKNNDYSLEIQERFLLIKDIKEILDKIKEIAPLQEPTMSLDPIPPVKAASTSITDNPSTSNNPPINPTQLAQKTITLTAQPQTPTTPVPAALQPPTQEKIPQRVDQEAQQQEQPVPAPTQTWYDAISTGLTNMWQGVTNFFGTVASTIRSWFNW